MYMFMDQPDLTDHDITDHGVMGILCLIGSSTGVGLLKLITSR